MAIPQIHMDYITIIFVVFVVIIIFAVAGASIHIESSHKNELVRNANNNNQPRNNTKAVDVPDEAYLSKETRKHLLLEQERYYTDECPLV